MPVRNKLHQGKPRARNGDQKRARIATQAARIMAEEGVTDFQTAKRKAIARLNLGQARNLPTNEEIEAELTSRLHLFQGSQLEQDIRRLRETALAAMRFLSQFEPRLVGSVLAGTVTPSSEIQLHVSADTPEQIGLFLRDHRIDFRLAERRIRFGDRYRNVATYRFTADGVMVEISVFDPIAAREAPLSPVDGRPMRRANLEELCQMLGQQ